MTDTFCPLPWTHLATHPEGKSTLCCVSDHKNNMSAARTHGKVLNFNDGKKVIEIMNSDYYVKVRQQMKEGIKPGACLRCYVEEESLITSKRELELARFGRDFIDNNGVIEPNLKFIELRLGNLCNVRCRTCNPASSSQWVTEYQQLEVDLQFVTHYDKIDTFWTQSDKFWDDLLDSSKQVELIYINGGEPTLVEKHWHYLERLIERGLHKQVKLWYSINMTNVPDKLLEIWKQFKEVEVHCSIDDIGDRNSYIRKGTRWEDVETNLKKLQDNPWLKFSVTQTVSWMNIYYVKEFKEYFDTLGIQTQSNLVYDPKFYSISILPEQFKERLRERLEGFDYLLEHVSSDINIDLFKRGLEFNDYLDNNRNESFETIFPEWYNIINELSS